MIAVITFFVIIVSPGKEPFQYGIEVPTLEDCLTEVKSFVEKMPKALQAGGLLQSGCSIKYPPTDAAHGGR